MRPLAVLALLSVVTLYGCAKKPVLLVDSAFVRLSAAPRGPAAGYFTVHGGPTTDRLMEVSSPMVIRIEMHDSMIKGGMSTMKPIDGGVEIPAGGTVEFKPGGRHLMMFYINPGMLPPRTLQMNFSFASGERIMVDAKILRAGDQ